MQRCPTLVRRAGTVLAAVALLASCGGDGDAAEGPRTIRVVMDDHRFEPSRIDVPKGEAVRLEFVNEGSFYHEAYLGTKADQDAHEVEMTAPGPPGTDGPPMTAEDGTPITASDGHAHTHAPAPTHGTGAGEPHPVVVAPGESGVLEHTFDSEGETMIGCHEEGHYAAGMTITISVE